MTRRCWITGFPAGETLKDVEGAVFLGDAAQVNPLETGFATPTWEN